MCIQALELLCIFMLLILERQCEDQLPGGIYWEEDVTKWSNVPATNMVGERDFAVLDLLVRQKPARGRDQQAERHCHQDAIPHNLRR